MSSPNCCNHRGSTAKRSLVGAHPPDRPDPRKRSHAHGPACGRAGDMGPVAVAVLALQWEDVPHEIVPGCSGSQAQQEAPKTSTLVRDAATRAGAADGSKHRPAEAVDGVKLRLLEAPKTPRHELAARALETLSTAAAAHDRFLSSLLSPESCCLLPPQTPCASP